MQNKAPEDEATVVTVSNHRRSEIRLAAADLPKLRMEDVYRSPEFEELVGDVPEFSPASIRASRLELARNRCNTVSKGCELDEDVGERLPVRREATCRWSSCGALM